MSKKRIFKLVIFLVILVASCFVYANYGTMKARDKTSEKELNMYIEHKELSLSRYELTLTQQLLYEKNQDLDTLIKDEPSETKDYYVQQFQPVSLFELEGEPFKFYAIDHSDDSIVTNDKTLADKNNKQGYYYFLRFDYDANGAVKIQGDYDYFSKMVSKKQFMEDFIDSKYSEFNAIEYDEINQKEGKVLLLENPKNMSFIYAIPKTYALTDFYKYSPHGISSNSYTTYLVPYVGMGTLLIFLFILLYPITVVKECNPYKTLKKVKFEIATITSVMLVYLMVLLTPMVVAMSCDGSLIKLLTGSGSYQYAWMITMLINIGMWFVVFQFIAYICFLIKYIFLCGFAYFKNTSLLGLGVKWLKETFHKITSFDFNASENQYVLKVVLVNGVVMIIVSFFSTFALVLIALYTLFLLHILSKKVKVIKQEYHALLDASEALSKGKFDVEIDTNLGMFQSLGQSFQNIKEGFETAVNEEIKSQKMKTELISNVSHDLKTPLTTLITYTDLLKGAQSEAEKITYIEILERNELRLKHLITDLFEVSKANSGNVHLDIKKVDVVSLFQQVHLECLDQNQEKQLTFKIHTTAKHIELNLDSEKTYRIFENLLVNIYKYSLANTRVFVNIMEEETAMHIVFRNISEQEITIQEDELLERFVQGDPSRNSTGSGLGLAIVKSFTNVQGGEIKLTVDGDVFKVELIFPK